MGRFYMFTVRTYGTWLPGREGFVGKFVNSLGERRIEHEYGSPTADPMPALTRYADDTRTHDVRVLTAEEAGGVQLALIDAAKRRGRVLHGVAVMPDHVHWMFVGGPSDGDDLRRLRNDWKSLTSWGLNRQFGRRRWWVRGGSTRWYPWSALGTVARYLWEQRNCLSGMLSAEATEAMLELTGEVDEA